ncbi:DUF6074 family protein [Jiella pelagia]|uniref:DUF6074 family protein n=1 Tax=Jiella pelagia TaxID=2986949 RepID=A0ABY7C0W2_9HYPH|nr:DUF6074 family protein [Jiella pelagia]WAP69302.1 DUF6074 family protein [Jiella pelagia]
MDLLSWERPTATIYQFPVSREIGRVRQVALALNSRQGKQAEKYWRTECNRLFGRLQAHRMPDVRIREEIECFAAAVQRELRGMCQGREQEPIGGDAA